MFKSIPLRAICAALTFSIASPSDAQQAGYTVTTPSAVIEIGVSMAVTVTLGTPFSELSIANPEIADISSLSETQLYLLGKTIGKTTLTVMREQQDVFDVTDYTIVVFREITPLQTFLAGAAPSVDLSRDGVTVTAKGCVDTPRAAAAAERVTRELETWGYVTLADIGAC